MTRRDPRSSGPEQPVRAWQRLFSLEQRALEDRQLLERQLEHWRAARGGIDAALYAEAADGGYRCLARAGRHPFPERLSAAGDDGCVALTLPFGLVLVAGAGADKLAADGAGDGESKDGDLLLLAAAARISELKTQLQEHHFQARFRGVELEALYDVGLAIASTLDLDALGEEVLLRAMSLLDARRGALYLIDGDAYVLHSHFGGGDTRSPLACDDSEVAALLAGDGRPETLMPGADHVLAAPVEIDGEARGLLAVADKESRHGVGPFAVADRRTLALFANQAAIALENAKLMKLSLEKERLEREMELAAEIQQQILPVAMPRIAGYEVLGWNRPARQVGGDYFDFRAVAEDRWSLVVADVTGKGMPAALLVSTLHSALRLLPDTMPIGPGLLERLNRHVFEASSSNKFITLLLAELDPQSGEVRYLNAGHNPGVLVRRDGSIEELAAGGMPLGLMARATYQGCSVAIERGELLCLYSDGITETESPDDEEFGFERLVELLRAQADAPLPAIIAAIDETTTAFASGQPQGDDQTVVLLRRLP